MNKSLEEQLASLVEAANNSGTEAVEFIKAQAPDYFTELVRWHLWKSVFDAFTSAIWTSASVGSWLFFSPMLMSWWRENDPKAIDQPRVIVVVFFYAVVIPWILYSACELIAAFKNIAMTWVSPKVIIADAIQTAIRRTKA